ncbi:G-protein coupled receptor [Oopsacas minuta]|uniref:G-protein coupled receptor n=1 Tax=Oopsacas minuta TaxID=111878 RepID=A0AAV7K021_9METZ|nr:G-protein coupled receptor [Oopsacas minuta]
MGSITIIDFHIVRDFLIQPITCVTNECTEDQAIRTVVTYDVIEGTEYILDTTETVATIGTSVSDFVDDIAEGDPAALRQLLNATLSPALTYLGGVNDEVLQPYYPEIFNLIDDLFYELHQNFSMYPEVRARNLVRILLGWNRSRTRNRWGNQENITCVLTELLLNDNIQDIIGYLEVLQDLPQRMSIIRPILQVFSQSYLFENKFNELRYAIPSSEGATLCVDAILANLVCPLIGQNQSERRYCQSLCADTLVYCTAILAQSLQDFSDVLDSVVILTVGYINSEQFEYEFNSLRDDLLFVIEGTLDSISSFDVITFVNEVCIAIVSILVFTYNSLSVYFLSRQLIIVTLYHSSLTYSHSLTFYHGEALNEDSIRQLIDSILPSLASNVTIDIPPYVIDQIEQSLSIDAIRNVTQNIYLPNGYLLDGILSLSVYYTLLFDPPQGCGDSYGPPAPLSFVTYYGYNYDCFDGESNNGNSPSYNYDYYYGCGAYPGSQCSFSIYSLYNNIAAQRTCSFSTSNVIAARIETDTNLCTIFLNLYPESFYILNTAVVYNNRLPYCRDFVIPVNTTGTPTPSISTPTSTLVTVTPIDPPIVSFPQQTLTWTQGTLLEYPCTATGTDVEVNIVNNNGLQTQFFENSDFGDVYNLIFNATNIGIFEFQCIATNPAGVVSATVIVTVQSVEATLDVINNIPLDEPLTPEVALGLISVAESLIGIDSVQNSTEQASQLLNVAALIVDSVANPNRNITDGEAESLLLLLGDIGGLVVEPDVPVNPDVMMPLSVPAAVGLQARGAEDISNNIVNQLDPGETRVINSPNIIIRAMLVEPQPNEDISLDVASGESVTIGNDFESTDVVGVATARISSPLTRDQEDELTTTPELNTVLVALSVFVNGNQRRDFSDNPPNIIFESPDINTAIQECSFIDPITNAFVADIRTEIIDNGLTSCMPEHTTSFGVLIRAQEFFITPAETLALSIISYILLSISLIFLVVSIIFFLIAAKKFFKVEINILYFNYAFSMALATSVFIFGIQTARDSIAGCSIVAFLLHYFWLSVFSWSFAISIFMIYILYIGVFKRRRIWWAMMIIGWGLPLPIVIITAAVGLSRNDYVVIGDHCFLSYNNGLLWGFFVPFILLLVVTTVAAIISIIKIFLTIRAKGDKVDEFDAIKKTALAIIVLLPILSIPWILGIINVFITSLVATTIIEWVTILLTAPTGAVFFFLVVLRNAQVQEVIFRRRADLPPSSQTSGGISGKYTMPSKAKESGDLTKEENTAITNPAYETPKQVDLDKETAKQDVATEERYAVVSKTPEKSGDGKAYESLLASDDIVEKEKETESPTHQYSQLSKDD